MQDNNTILERLDTVEYKLEKLEQTFSQAQELEKLDTEHTEYLTRDQYAEKFKITPRTVDRHIRADKLKAVRLYGRILIPVSKQTESEDE